MPIFLPFSFYLILGKEKNDLMRGLWFFSVRNIILFSCRNSRMHVYIWVGSWRLPLIILPTGERNEIKGWNIRILNFAVFKNNMPILNCWGHYFFNFANPYVRQKIKSIRWCWCLIKQPSLWWNFNNTILCSEFQYFPSLRLSNSRRFSSQ